MKKSPIIRTHFDPSEGWGGTTTRLHADGSVSLASGVSDANGDGVEIEIVEVHPPGSVPQKKIDDIIWAGVGEGIWE